MTDYIVNKRGGLNITMLTKRGGLQGTLGCTKVHLSVIKVQLRAIKLIYLDTFISP